MTNKKNLSDAEKARLARNAYMRKWSKQNKEKIKEYQKRHYAKKYEEMLENGQDPKKAS